MENLLGEIGKGATIAATAIVAGLGGAALGAGAVFTKNLGNVKVETHEDTEQESNAKSKKEPKE